MKRSYPLIANRVASEMWAITPTAMHSILACLNGATAAMDMPPMREREMEDDDEDEWQMDGRVALIPVSGIIGKHLSSLEMECGGCDVNAVAAMLREAVSDDGVSSIVMQFHSPGGTVTGVPELAEKIRQASKYKPVIAYTDSLCCSAAYWLASACSAIYAAPSATVGSIGVYNLLLDRTRQMEEEGVKVNAIVDGKFKLAGAEFRQLSDDEKAMFQAKVEGIGKAFRGFILSQRPDVAAEFMEGQTFNGIESAANGLVDGLANDLDEVLEILKS